MSELTTAQRLASYRDELLDAGFDRSQMWDLVETVAPSLFEDLRISADTKSPRIEIVNVFGYSTPAAAADHLDSANESTQGAGWPSDNEIVGDAIRYFGRHISGPAHEFAEQAIREAARRRDLGDPYHPYPEKPFVRVQAPDGSCVCRVCS